MIGINLNQKIVSYNRGVDKQYKKLKARESETKNQKENKKESSNEMLKNIDKNGKLGLIQQNQKEWQNATISFCRLINNVWKILLYFNILLV